MEDAFLYDWCRFTAIIIPEGEKRGIKSSEIARLLLVDSKALPQPLCVMRCAIKWATDTLQFIRNKWDYFTLKNSQFNIQKSSSLLPNKSSVT